LPDERGRLEPASANHRDTNRLLDRERVRQIDAFNYIAALLDPLVTEDFSGKVIPKQ